MSVNNDEQIGRDLMARMSERKSIYEDKKNHLNVPSLRASVKAFDNAMQTQIFEERFKKKKVS